LSRKKYHIPLRASQGRRIIQGGRVECELYLVVNEAAEMFGETDIVLRILMSLTPMK
jgi:hypothetical protein